MSMKACFSFELMDQAAASSQAPQTRSDWAKQGLWGPRIDCRGLTWVSESDFSSKARVLQPALKRRLQRVRRSFAGRSCLSFEPSLTKIRPVEAENRQQTPPAALELVTVEEIQKKPPLWGAKMCARRAPPRGRRRLYLSVLIGRTEICPLGFFS